MNSNGFRFIVKRDSGKRFECLYSDQQIGLNPSSNFAAFSSHNNNIRHNNSNINNIRQQKQHTTTTYINKIITTTYVNKNKHNTTTATTTYVNEITTQQQPQHSSTKSQKLAKAYVRSSVMLWDIFPDLETSKCENMSCAAHHLHPLLLSLKSLQDSVSGVTKQCLGIPFVCEFTYTYIGTEQSL